MLISWQLRRGRLARLVASLREQKLARPLSQAIADLAPQVILSSYAAARLYRSPAGRCLSGSIALSRHLSGIGCASTLVIGIRAEPFAAHSWVQVDRFVLNDMAEEVRRFTPILAL
ncbi:MAG: lasso peptide biosynthesis B2 protein [Sphingopyxis sp.]|nr:lasso peptide biosynthesis B2 protein [Sphingopyxis sp.]